MERLVGRGKEVTEARGSPWRVVLKPQRVFVFDAGRVEQAVQEALHCWRTAFS